MPSALRNRAGLWLFAAVWLVYSVCPPFLSYDSFWTVASAASLIGQGTTAVDRYVRGAPAAAAYGLECVPPQGPPRRVAWPDGCTGGNWYNLYFVGSAVLAAPLMLVMKAAAALVGPLIPHTGLFARPEVAAFFAGDLVRGRPLTELWCASTFGALAVWVQYRIARRFLERRAALGLALLFAFGTAQWSVASRNLFPQGLTVLLLSGALWAVLRAEDHPRAMRWAGLLLALSFTVRPSNAISCAGIAAYVAVHRRRQLADFVLWAGPVAAVFFGYYAWVRHSPIPLYVTSALEPIPPLEGGAMYLFSPSRGLLVFTPLVLVSAVGAVAALWRGWCRPLAAYLVAIVLVQSSLSVSTWQGHGYGPRYFTDLLPYFMLFLIPAIEWWRETPGTPRRALAAGFLAVAAWGVFTNGRGGTSVAANQWSALPRDVNTARERVWDWSDPQFLRGLE
jgi:hypothetical protein